MSDAFDRLIDQVPLAPRTAEPEPGTIVVGLDRATMTAHRMRARVFLDGHRAAWLDVANRAASLPVGAGEHRVSVRYGREESGPLTVHVEPGGRVEVICRQTEPWMRLQLRTSMRIVFLPMFCIALVGVVWLAHPLVFDGSDLLPGLTSFLRRSSLGRAPAAMAMFPIGFLSGIAIIFAWRAREIRRFRAEHGSGISLAIRAGIGPG